MKLYTYPGAPSPQRVELLLAEKGLDIPRVTVDLTQKEQFDAAFHAKSPNCDVPVLELDDGTCISQVPAICLYLEDAHPQPPLYGTDTVQRAQVMMWDHLVFINGFLAVAEVLRNQSKGMAGRPLPGPHDYDQIPALADRGRQRTRDFFADMDQRLEQTPYVAGDFFSMADISAWVSCNFARWVKEEPEPGQKALKAWYEKVSARKAMGES